MQGVFSSAGQALHVSYLMEILPVTQAVSTQILIEWLQRQAGVPPQQQECTRTLNFGGLSPLEVRGQCAIVRASVEHHLPGPERDVVLARYGHQTTKARGVAGVARYVQQLTAVQHDLAVRAVAWGVFHPAARAQDRMSLRDIADETGVSFGQLQRAGQVIRAQRDALLKMAEGRMLALFERTGLVEKVARETLQAA